MKRKNKKNEAPAVSEESKEETVAASTEEIIEATLEEDHSAESEQPPVPEAVLEEAPTEDAPAELAPAKTSSPLGEIIKITLPLSIICVVVALMLSVVNAMTEDKIAANAQKEKEAAILSIFPEGESTELYSSVEGTDIYLVKVGETTLGYCVGLSENGFGGPVQMMVGVDTTGAVSGVRIVSMSETPGFGTKVKNESFLATFTGRDAFVLGENLDGVSGATRSSKAVVQGVNRAMETIVTTFSIDIPADEAEAQSSVSVIPPAVPVTPAETGTPTTTHIPETAVASAPETTVVLLAASIPWEPMEESGKTVNRVRLSGEETIYVMETEAPPETDAPPETIPVETQPEETTLEEPASVETEEIAAESDTETTIPADTSAELV